MFIQPQDTASGRYEDRPQSVDKGRAAIYASRSARLAHLGRYVRFDALRSIRNLRIRGKQALIVLAAVIGMAAIGVVGLMDLRRNLMEDRKVQTRHVVEVVESLLMQYASLEKKGVLTPAEARRQAIDAVTGLRYGDNEYFWITDLDLRMLVHPIMPELNGRDVTGFTDPSGKYVFVEFANTTLSSGAGFVSYLWPKPGSDISVPKISYVKAFQPWGWIVGSGLYVDDVTAIFRHRAIVLAGSILAILIFVAVVSWMIADNIIRPLKSITAAVLHLSRGDTAVDVGFTNRGDELGHLARTMDTYKQSLNEMNRLRAEANRVQESERIVLRESEERYRGMFTQCAVPMFLANPTDGTIVDANHQAHAFFGYAPTQMRKLRLTDICSGDCTVGDRLLRDAGMGKSSRFVSRCVAASGVVHDVEVIGQPIRITGEDLLHVIVLDETERRRAEGALRRSEARVASLFKAAPIGIGWVSDGILKETNARFCSMLGYGPEDLRDKNIRLLFPSDSEFENVIEKHHIRAKRHGTMTLETRLQTKDGNIIDVLLSTAPLDPKNPSAGLTLTALDVTDRKKADNALKEREQLMRSLLESAGEGIYGIDRTGTITFCNPACMQILGYSDDRPLMGMNSHHVIHGCSPERDGECGICRICDAYRYGRGVHVEDATFWRADNTAIPVEYRSHPLCRGDEIVGAVVSFTDISERKRAKAEIYRLNRDLERRVAQRTAELEMVNRELEAFAYTVSHDLRAPLRSINGFSDIILDDYADELDAEGKRLIERIRANGRSMDCLIDDILTLSRSTRAEIRRVPVDVSAMARSVADELSVTAPNRDVIFEITEAMTCCGDPKYLRVILENLLGNAWKYSRMKSAARIEFGVDDDKSPAVFFVRDNGAGFDMAQARKLFQPFQRFHSAREFEGNGVGLATVQRIVQRHGGEIWAEAKAGEGAAFYFTLDAKSEELR